MDNLQRPATLEDFEAAVNAWLTEKLTELKERVARGESGFHFELLIDRGDVRTDPHGQHVNLNWFQGLLYYTTGLEQITLPQLEAFADFLSVSSPVAPEIFGRRLDDIILEDIMVYRITIP